jgi:subtilisin family serine protease
MKFDRVAASLASLVDDYRSQGPHGLMAAPRSVPLASAPGASAPWVSVFVRAQEKADLGKVAGVQVHQATGTIRTARVPLDRVEDFADQAGVVRVAAARRLRPVDVASAKVHLPAYRMAAPQSRTGKGVLIGLVDTGIDSTHQAFAGRILSVWDQTMTGNGWGTTTYGNVLTGEALATSLDVNGHGSHVAGIAAGTHSTYGGVAPEADLVVVKTDFQNTSIADGVRYVFDQADRLGRPAVVNLSLGGHWDPHDGTDDLSAAIDALTGAGRIVVAAAGNEGEDPIHAAVTVPGGSEAEVPFQTVPSTQPAAPQWVVLNGWYPGAAPLEVSVQTPAGDVTPFQAMIAGASPVRNYQYNTARVRVTTPPAAVNPNGDYQVLVEILPGPFNSRVQGGRWRLRFRNPGQAPVRVDVWSLVDGDAPAAIQSPAVSDDMKVGSPGAAASVVTVGAYTTRNQWVDAGGSPHGVGLALDNICAFSSPGPLRTGAQKPDVTAPGAMIISCRSASANPTPSNVVAPGFMVDAGTSMASPFVTGLVALLLQQQATLTPAQVKVNLKAASAVPNREAGTFDPKWGFGLIDAQHL